MCSGPSQPIRYAEDSDGHKEKKETLGLVGLACIWHFGEERECVYKYCFSALFLLLSPL